MQAKQTMSFIDFKGNTPKRCLDIGTGVSFSLLRYPPSQPRLINGSMVKLGDWVIDAAKQWTDCTFVSILLCSP